MMLTYIMLGWGLNIVIGLAGLLDLGYVAFYAVGAYSYALFCNSFWLVFLGLPTNSWNICCNVWCTFRISGVEIEGDYLAMITLAFGEMIRILLLNWYELTKDLMVLLEYLDLLFWSSV